MRDQPSNCEKPQIADAKLHKYLLNPNHPETKVRPIFYELIGYTTTNGEQLRTDLLTLACSGSVIDELPNRVSRKYVTVGSINAPNGKTYTLRLNLLTTNLDQ